MVYFKTSIFVQVMNMNPPELVDAVMDPMMMAMGTMLGKGFLEPCKNITQMGSSQLCGITASKKEYF